METIFESQELRVESEDNEKTTRDFNESDELHGSAVKGFIQSKTVILEDTRCSEFYFLYLSKYSSAVLGCQY